MSTLVTCSLPRPAHNSAALYPVPVPISSTRSPPVNSGDSSILAISDGCDDEDSKVPRSSSFVTSGVSR